MRIEAERLSRGESRQAKRRARNRASGIPDMEVGDRHEPAEWFGQLGFFWVLDKVGRSQPDEDWSEDGGSERDREAFLAARRLDQQRVADWLREAEVSAIPSSNGVRINRKPIRWVDRVPALKVWAGRQTLASLFAQRQKALPKEVSDVLACQSPITGSSGLYRPCASTALEDGFGADAVGLARMTPIGLEMLAIIGIDTVPLIVFPDRAIGYEAAGKTFSFRIEDRSEYYGRWGTAESKQ